MAMPWAPLTSGPLLEITFVNLHNKIYEIPKKPIILKCSYQNIKKHLDGALHVPLHEGTDKVGSESNRTAAFGRVERK